MDKKESIRILDEAKAVLTQYIEGHGLRKTQERYAILEAAYNFNGSFSIEELSEEFLPDGVCALRKGHPFQVGGVGGGTARYEIPSLPHEQCYHLRLW